MTRFSDRSEAGRLLAEQLAGYRKDHPLILGIPRGGLPVAAEVVRALDGDLDVILVHKLGMPGNPEYAIGAIDEQGYVELDASARVPSFRRAGLAAEIARESALLRQRRELYAPARKIVPLAGRTVIVVDDGLATGDTMLTALHSARSGRPARLIAAAPVASGEGIRHVRHAADDVVVLMTPEPFSSVGEWYHVFRPTADEEVARLLSSAAGRPA